MPKSKPVALTFDRRDLLVGAASAALAGFMPRSVHAQGAGPEVTKAVFGYIALTDAAPLIIAKEKGIFEKYGMKDVDVAKQASWGATRDNLVLGSEANGIDGAHILTPMPYLITAGKVTQNNIGVPMSILARLNCDGQGLSVSNEYKDLEASAIEASQAEGCLREEEGRRQGSESRHDLLLAAPTILWIRYWLAAAGIDPDKDVSTIVVPPPQMVANMKVGNMDAFCVGEPWNEQLVNQGIGFTALPRPANLEEPPGEDASGALRLDRPPIPKATQALLMAVLEAAAMVRQAGEQGRDVARSWAVANGSTCRPPMSRAA